MAMEYSSWWPAPSWISPGAALFLLCNVLVGAIVVTSSRGDRAGGRAAASTRRLCRSASSMVLDRLRSFSMFSVHPAPVLDGYDPAMELEEEQPHQPAGAELEIPRAPANTVVAETEASATAAYASSKSAKEEAVQEPACQGHAQQQPPSPSSQAVSTAAAAVAEATAAAERPATVVGSIVQRARACRREFVEEALEGKAALNARAELFIQQFREDLKLQRLNSIINYTRALRRGAGGAAPAAGE